MAVAARDVSRGKAYAEQHGIERVHASYADLVRDPDVDLVYIGTPPAFHAELALAAIAAGKSVLVEKPFSLDSNEAAMVRNAARVSGVHVFEAMHSLHHRLFARILDIVRGGGIGAVRGIEASFIAPIAQADPFRWRRELGGGALMDLGVYPLAWVRRLLGNDFCVTSCDTVFRQGVDESFVARLEYAGGLTCVVTSSMAGPSPEARLVVRGDDGILDVRNPIAPQHGHSLLLTNASGERIETFDGPSSYESQLEAVVASLSGAPFPLPPDDYVRSMEAIDKVRERMSNVA